MLHCVLIPKYKNPLVSTLRLSLTHFTAPRLTYNTYTHKHLHEHQDNTANMKFSIAIVAAILNIGLSVAVPQAAPAGMVQKLDPRSVTGDIIVGRSFSCASNSPTECCAVSTTRRFYLYISAQI